MFLIPDVSLAEPDTVTESDVMIWFEVGVFMVIVGSVVSIPPDPPPLWPDPPPLPPQIHTHFDIRRPIGDILGQSSDQI